MILAGLLAAALPLMAATPSPTTTPTPPPDGGPDCIQTLPQWTATPWPGPGAPGLMVLGMALPTYLFTFDTNSNAFGYLGNLPGRSEIEGLAVDPANPSTLVASLIDSNGNLPIISASGTSSSSYGYVTGGALTRIAFSPIDGSLYVADFGNSSLYRIPSGGGNAVVIKNSSSGLIWPMGLAFDSAGWLYMADNANGQVYKLDVPSNPMNPTMTSCFASGQQNRALAVDGKGRLWVGTNNQTTNQGYIFRVNTATCTQDFLISQFSPLAEAGGGPLYMVYALAMDLNGYIWASVHRSGVGDGLLKIDPNSGTPLAYVPMPATISGITISPNFPEALAIQGLLMPLTGCGPPSNTPSRTPSPSPSCTPTASPTATPSATASPSPTISATSSPTRSPSPTPSPGNSPTFSATPSATISPLAVAPVGPAGSYVYPSPLPPGSTVFCVYQMKEPGNVEIEVWNAAGDLAAQVFDPGRPAGLQQSGLRLNFFAAGVYYYRVTLRYASGSVENLKPQKFAVLP